MLTSMHCRKKGRFYRDFLTLDLVLMVKTFIIDERERLFKQLQLVNFPLFFVKFFYDSLPV